MQYFKHSIESPYFTFSLLFLFYLLIAQFILEKDLNTIQSLESWIL